MGTEQVEAGREIVAKDRSQADVGSAPLIAVSESQRALLSTIYALESLRGRWPTFRELQEIVVIASSPLSRALQMLEALGLIVWRKTIEVVRGPDGLFFGPEILHARCCQERPAAVSTTGQDATVRP